MQNQLLKLLSFTLAFFCFTQISAQQKRTEIGLTYNNDVGFSLLIKEQIKKKTFLRGFLNLPSGRFATEINGAGNSFSAINVGGSLGLEIHVPLSKRFTLYHGPELSVQYARQNVNERISTNETFSVGYFTGAIFKVTDRLSIFGEVNSAFNFNNQISGSSQATTFQRRNYNLDSSLALGASFNLKGKKRQS